MLSPTHRSPRVILEVPTSAVLTFDTQQRLTREEVPDLISYAKLWRLLDKRRFSPRDIVWMAGISESTYQKLVKNDSVRLDVLQRICEALNVDIGDVCSFRTRQ